MKPSRPKASPAPSGFPDTAYFLPVIYSFTGEKMQTLADLRRILKRAKELLPARPSDKVWLPYLGNTLDAGVAALFACEIIEACKYLIGPNPVDGIWLGAANDVIMRERGIEFVDGSAPGFAAITGAAPTNEDRRPDRPGAAGEEPLRLHGRLHERQAVRRTVGRRGRPAWLGHPPGAVRQGRVGPDLCPRLCQPRRPFLRRRQARRLRRQPEVQQEPHLRLRAGAGRSDAREVRGRGRGHQLRLPRHRRHGHPADSANRRLHLRARRFATCRIESMVEKALEVRGCKIKITKVPIPVPYGPAFEGERIRKADAHVEFGGNKTTAFEFVTMADLDADQRRGDRGDRPRHRYRPAGRGAAAGDLGRSGGPEDAARFRADPRAPDSPPGQRRRGHLAHGPARHRLDARIQGGLTPRACACGTTARSCTPSCSRTTRPSWTRSK